jgi:hypothetical protein
MYCVQVTDSPKAFLIGHMAFVDQALYKRSQPEIQMSFLGSAVWVTCTGYLRIFCKQNFKPF